MKHLVLLCTLATGLMYAQNEKWNTTISVSVSADGKLKQDLITYLSRELRSLGDVTIKEEDGLFTLYVTAMPAETKAHVQTGVIISVRLAQSFPFSIVEKALNKESPKEVVNFLRSYLGNYESHEWGSIYFGDEVRERCTTIVNDLDAKVFQPRRKSYEELVGDEARKKVHGK